MKDLKTILIIGIIILVLIVAAVALEWLKSARTAENLSSGIPYDLVTTFKGDAETSRAFTWYTGDSGAAGLLQVVKGGKATFDVEAVIKVEADNTVIKTDKGSRGVHKAEVSGLEAGTLYTYRVGTGNEAEWSAAAQFTTAEADNDSVTFINVTDSQGVTAGDFERWGKTLNKAFQTF
ncbi:fibronectin type III domain-containing protein, partial [Paenibacillus ihuae]|uniref:fibronectin type III domain-containing protein n=1 Tax=Paenibacillus ihuae TaxID=1232431 RepID=UPI001FD76810